MRSRLFRRSILRRIRRVLAGDFRVVLILLGALLALIAGLRAGMGGATRPSVAPLVRPTPSRFPPDPGFQSGISIGPQEVRSALFRALEHGRPIYCGGGRQPVVALTFDDGPGPRTDEVLRILGREEVPATFFFLGERVSSPFGVDLVDRVGPLNAIANHGWSHRSLRRLRPKVRRAEIVRSQRAIERITTSVRLFRPPYGHRDGRLGRMLNELGLVEVLWNAEVGDDRRTTTRKVLARARRQLRPGAIVVMHERPETIAALPGIIAEIRKRGFQPVTVPELLALDPPSAEQLAKGQCRTQAGLAPPEIGGSRP
ncbi:MAG TPA: polysaccharide deacetylase family protein [Actinomycetota bacterium]|nr:polysaccharide deacetylase family protein [Actinomycetota bacterium]